MATLQGIRALLATGGEFYTPYEDRIKAVDIGDESRHAVMLIESNADVAISLNLKYLPPMVDTNCHSFAFHLTIGGRTTNFRSYLPADLLSTAQVISNEDLTRLQKPSSLKPLKLTSTPLDCIVELKVLRMDTPKIKSTRPLKDEHKKVLVKGQLIAANSGSGVQKIVSDDLSSTDDAVFLDELDKPYLTFTWTCKTKAQLEGLLVIPRAPVSPFKILPSPSLYGPIDLEIPIGTRYLTKGYDLQAIDNLAFRQLNDNKSSREEQPMKYPLEQSIHEEAHNRTLRALTYLGGLAYLGGDDLDESGYAVAAMKTASQTDWSHPPDDLEEKANRHVVAQVKKLSNEETAVLCCEQICVTTQEELRMPKGHSMMFTARRIYEKTYLRAKVQVLRVLAEEKMESMELERKKSNKTATAKKGRGVAKNHQMDSMSMEDVPNDPKHKKGKQAGGG